MKRSDFLKNIAATVAAGTMLPLMALASIKSISPENSVKIVRKAQGQKLNVIGDQMSVKLTGKDTGGQYALVEQYNDPGVGIPPHVHEKEDEVFKLIEGEVEFSLEGKTHLLKAGDMIYCPRGVPHTWKVVGTRKAKVDLGFFPSGMEVMFEELAQLPQGPPDLEVVAKICGRYGISFI